MGTKVDQTTLRFNQACIVGFIAVAFVLGQVALIAFVAAILVVGTIWPNLGLFKAIYQQILRPARILRPSVIADDPAPHRFAQGVGGTFLVASSACLVAGLPVGGWVLAGIVLVLAGINLVIGFCAGCFMYYQLGRAGLLGQRARTGEGHV